MHTCSVGIPTLLPLGFTIWRLGYLSEPWHIALFHSFCHGKCSERTDNYLFSASLFA